MGEVKCTMERKKVNAKFSFTTLFTVIVYH